MKQYSIFHPLWMSFYSKSLYRDVAYNWRGIGFLLLLMLITIHSTIIGVKFNSGIQKFVNDDVPAFVSQIPPITITNGKLSTEEARPYRIEDPKTKELIAIIDATQTSPPSDLDGAKLFITQTEVITQKSTREKRTYDLSDIESFVLNQERINGWLTTLATFGGWVSFPFILFGLLVYRFFQLLLFSVVTLISAQIFKTPKLSYGSVLRLTVIAMTPALLLTILKSLFSITLPLPGITFFIIVLIYIVFITLSLKEEPPVVQEEIQ